MHFLIKLILPESSLYSEFNYEIEDHLKSSAYQLICSLNSHPQSIYIHANIIRFEQVSFDHIYTFSLHYCLCYLLQLVLSTIPGER